MEIDNTCMLLLGKHIYNTVLDKFGYISNLEIMASIEGYCICPIVYYDTFHSRDILSIEDFEKGILQFVIVTDYDFMKEEYLENIKTILGDKFSERMILYISEEERKAKLKEEDKRNVQMLSNELLSLTRVSAHVVSDNFGAREIYLKYKNGVLTEKEMLYAMINHLSYELKRVEESNTKYFFEYKFLPEIEEIIKKELDNYDIE